MLILFILRPFIGTILTAIVISYLCYPLYRWIDWKSKNRTVSAFVTLFLLILIISIPSAFVINAISKEAFDAASIAGKYLSTDSPTVVCDNNIVCGFLDFLGLAGLTEPHVNNFISSTIGKANDSAEQAVVSWIAALPRLLFNMFFLIFLIYYLLKDGRKLVGYIKTLMPFDSAHVNLITKRFNEVTYAVVYGNVVVAVIQGGLTAIGFLIFSASSPLIWGLVTVFTSLIPFLGAVVVWLPASIILVVSGYTSGDGFMILRGVGLFIFGILFISSIDNILKPRLIGGRANLHPALVLVGVIGGISALGVIGLIIGPVLVALATTVISIASKSRVRNRSLRQLPFFALRLF